ncbi:MAG: hypothetical protein HKP10_02095 [Kiritimatiellales bacterium]|nr:hypothetical protein [Kiritimatiellales bacterium]
MKTKSILSIVFLLACPLVQTHAAKGDTIAQAIAKYGSPVAEMASRGQTIHVYQTSGGKVTETYDKNGICVISDADLSAAEQIKPVVLNKPAAVNQSAASKPEQPAAEEGRQDQPRRKRPVLLILLFLGVCVGGIVVYTKYKKAPTLSL